MKHLDGLRNKIKGAAELVKDMRRVRQMRQDLEQTKQEKERYYTERQILFDQSQDMRIFLANKYLKGHGIEIGPAEHPLDAPHWTTVTYVDEVTTEELIKIYPYLKKHNLVNIDVIDDGQVLSKFKNNSQNFVIANHFLEHVIDPIKALRNFYRVLKPTGIIFMAVPDMRFTFDKLRPNTPRQRLIDFHADPKKAEAGKWLMLLETAEWGEGEMGVNVEKRARELRDQKFSIHLNVWSQYDLLELILYVIRTYKFKLDFEAVVKNEHEVIFVLQKKAKSNVVEDVSVERVRRAHAKQKKK